MEGRSNLVWSPTYAYVQEQLRLGEELRMIVAPFIRKNALLSIAEECKVPEALSVITRWTSQDIVSGISDLDIYPCLRDRGIALYLNQTIHLKLLVFASNWAFVTSSNITGKGMGLTEPYNLEVGCRTELGRKDWQSIYQLLGTSFRVDDDIYQKAMIYRDANIKPQDTIPDIDLIPKEDLQFSVLSLPATESPLTFQAFYFRRKPVPADSVAAFMHDTDLYRIPPGLSEDNLLACLHDGFRNQPFTQAMVALIRQAGSARFGQVNEWIKSNCSDKPTPYRWELKPSTRRMYNWLDYFFVEVTWDVPGTHSQVIRWEDGKH